MSPRRLFLGHYERTVHYKGKRNTFRFLQGLPDMPFQHRMPHYIPAALCACVEGTKELIPLLGTVEQPLTSHCSFLQKTALVLFCANVLSSLLNTCYSTWLNCTVLALNLQCQGALQMFLLEASERRAVTQYNQCLQGTLSSPDIRTFLKFHSVLLSATSRGHIQNMNKGDGFPYSETLLMISGTIKNSPALEVSRPDWMGLWD